MNKFREIRIGPHALPHKPHLIPGTQEYAAAEAEMVHDAAIEQAMEPSAFIRHLNVLRKLSSLWQALHVVNNRTDK